MAAPLAAAAIAAAWPRARTAMLSIPMPLMIGLNAARIWAVLFLLLGVEGRLAGPFPHLAGWGDIITGVLALPVAWLAKDAGTRHLKTVAAWNLFGAADLDVGPTSASRRWKVHRGIFMAPPGSAAMLPSMVVCSDSAGSILADPSRDHLGPTSSLTKPGYVEPHAANVASADDGPS